MSKESHAGGEQWASRIGVILAVAGSAVGLGNFLRFPGQAAQNGGGAFMLPYFISLLILGIPLCWAEWTMGRYGGMQGFNSAPAIYSTLWRNRFAKYFGAIALLIPLIIYMYYVLIEAWCLGYAVNYLTGDLTNEAMRTGGAEAYGEFFGNYTGISENGIIFEKGHGSQLVILGCCFAFNFYLVYKGVTKGIEKFCRVAMPLLVVLALIVLVRVLTLGTPDPAKPDQSLLGGIGFMWNPNFEALSDPKTWLAAAGQIFFSISVGFGIIINYASYLKKEDDVVLSGLTSTSMNEFFEVCLGGLITLPAAFIFLGLAVEGQGTFGLGFNALPNVFAMMPGGRFIGFLWFFMLFIAAITSSVSMLQPVIAFLEEGFGLKRHASAALLGLITALGCAFVVYHSKGLVALDTFDFWIGSVTLFVLAFIQSILYGWCFGIERGAEEAHRGANIRIPHFVQLLLKYVVPVYLAIIFGMFCWNNVLSHRVDIVPLEGIAFQDLKDAPLQEQPNLLKALAEKEISIPDDAGLSVIDNKNWSVVSEEDGELFRLATIGGKLSTYKNQAGYLEKISSDKDASFSIMFIAIVAGFLVLLVHIAGKRWEAEGRLKFD